ncbi:hypothetical protein FNF29_08165 [Cafeteria roenbergensis]|uniref:Gfo/Idh/MocA-like oxidoreductase N-terminal domain-containing protein n=1 Tax=Cafeteria roenbergensis TaxID=33653 RepID=A0A5A8C2B6_CAFRO|nr:hypothetical protein FNF29_08165 [Cafeteria roenbergensis]|eukprot:KAA0146250.1 hypothetical protein FNF29_08165 [Cafeteria roenbergensis]
MAAEARRPSGEGSSPEPPPASAIIVGAGARGKTYAQYGLEHPDRLRIVGVAEPRAHHRNIVQQRFDLPPEAVFTDWTQLAARPRMADAVIIATQDTMHVAPAMAFADLGYHILLEKPMAVSTHDCQRIADAAKRNNVLLAVCHVLRYTPYMRKMIELIRSGAIGEVVNVSHLEPIGSWHFAHSYVRGAWRREDESSFMLMTKCCHDIDLIRHIVGKSCQRVASFGSVSHFRRDKKPPGAGMRCLSCSVEPTCPFSAKRLYLDPCREGHRGWPISGITDGEPTPPDVEEALNSGPYGRCVYECDNDVCDQQVVSMEFDGGVTATLTTAAFTHKVCQRHTRVFGTRGELEGDGDSELVWFDFATRARKVIHTGTAPATTRMTGHGGADYHLADAFVQALRQRDPTRVLSGPDETLESHLIVFAAEAARRSGQVLSVPTALKHGLHGAVAEARGGDPSSHASIVERVGPELHQALRRLERGPDDSPMAPLGMALPPSTTAPISAAATLPPRIEAALGGVLTPSTKVHVTAMPAHTLPAAAAAAGAGAGSPLRSPAPYASPALTPLGRPSFAERGRSANTPHRQLTAPPSPPPLASNLSDLDDDDDDMVEDEDDARQGGKAAAANQSSSSSSSSSSSAAAAAAATGAARG